MLKIIGELGVVDCVLKNERKREMCVKNRKKNERKKEMYAKKEGVELFRIKRLYAGVFYGLEKACFLFGNCDCWVFVMVVNCKWFKSAWEFLNRKILQILTPGFPDSL
jgi:hypothetical protein